VIVISVVVLGVVVARAGILTVVVARAGTLGEVGTGELPLISSSSSGPEPGSSINTRASSPVLLPPPREDGGTPTVALSPSRFTTKLSSNSKSVSSYTDDGRKL